MTRSKQLITGFTFLFVLFCMFVYFHGTDAKQNAGEKLLTHSKIIENALWNLDQENPKAYLQLALVHEGYNHLWVIEKNGNVFIELEGEELSTFEGLLASIKLLPLTLMETDIFHDGVLIGKLSVHHISRTIYLNAYVFLVLTLVYLTFIGALRTLWAKNDLERKVQDRTKELALANTALEDNEDNLRITLNSIGDAVISTDVSGNIARMNPVAEQLTGYQHSEAQGKPLELIFSIHNGKTKETAPNPFDKVIATGEIIGLENDTILTSRDGTEYLIADSGAPIRNQHGDIVGVVLVFRDITEQARIEEELLQSQKMDSIGMLAGGVAHDFNNMLAGILGYSELLESQLKDKKLKEYTETIIKSASRAADLTSKLLAFSRKGKIQSTTVDAHRIIQEVKSLLSRTIDRKIELKLTLKADYPIIVGDPSELQNAILNLGVNSRDALPNGGTITISTQNIQLNSTYCKACPFDIEPGTYLEICVQDDGLGMDAETKKNIFEPFFTTKDIGRGTGLGLAAVYGTIKDHKGAISVFSEEGKGASFHLYLPSSEKPIEAHSRDTIEGREFTPGCVLVIEDEDVVRSMIYELLTNEGYKVLLAEDGEQGVLTYQKNYNNIDVIILDMVMPKLSGKECFDEIKAITPEAKIIISSGFSENKTIQALKEGGAYAFIKKPYNFNNLKEIIVKAME